MNHPQTTRAVLNAFALAALLFFTAMSVGAQSYVNFEGKQTRPICLSPDGTRLFAVNTPDARLSVFDITHPLSPFLIAEIPVGVEPVSVNARDNDEVWVVNEVSDSVSIISVSNRLVVDTLYVKDEPADVVFAGGKAFVSAARKNQIVVFDLASRTLVTNIVVFGENPRSLAVNTNGTKVYAAFALSGNHTTLIPATNDAQTIKIAPPQITNGTPPMNPALPAPPAAGLIVEATDPAWYPSYIKYTMPDNDVVEIDVAALSISRYFSRVGTVNLALALQPGSGDLFVANTDARNLTHFEPALRGFFVTNRVSRVNVTSGAVTHFDLNRGYSPASFTSLDKTNALAQPTAIVFETDGVNYYVAAFGSDRIARVEAASGNITTRIELCPTAVGSASDPRNKRGTRGLALKPGAALYALNRLANTISIVELGSYTVAKEIPIGSYDPTPADVRNGRGFLYDAKLSGNGTVSCASCHIDAEMDLIAWDLGDPTGSLTTNQTVFQFSPGGVPTFQTNAFPLSSPGPGIVHPMKGPMTTQTLRGLKGMEPLHWRGDRADFAHFNGAFNTLLGGSVLSTADMSAYTNFINTIVFQANPNQNLDRSFPTNFAGANAAAGRDTFINDIYSPSSGLSCNTCHALPTGSDLLIDPKEILPSPNDVKVPHLRNIYQKTGLNRRKGSPAAGTNSIGGFGFTHDGSFPDIFTFLSIPSFGDFQNDTLRKTNLQAFLLCFDTGTAPAVGYTRTALETNVNTASISNDWSLLEAQAAVVVTNIDLIVKGTIDGIRHGLLYQPGANNYKLDTTNAAPITRAQLVAKILAGDTLTLTGVPYGAGPRMGIDRDLNGVLDADEPLPKLQIAAAGTSAVLNWPLSAAGFNLEETPGLSLGAWNSTTNAIEIFGAQNFTTNAFGNGAKFFRLHQP
jgi:YVTN family beta-propeller protein